MITGIAHVNLTVPPGTLDHANEFYVETLGLNPTLVPELQRGKLAWFNIGPPGGQQIHVGFGTNDPTSTRHPCFKLSTIEELEAMKKRIYEHHVRGGPAAPMAADQPGEMDSGEQGKEYPNRFFARDFAGNRLEFTL
ncbi:putative glyoxalase family protein [Lipomyces tetrasporus]|uniref:Glyoxalase family protein n=1 Tax=Lipomyces tetrasporus TaxID=54092 RepID=A0AAD7VSA6_9ASCO|nr:putative glyoxalase family protein [Lipomyces tetrasporus]KAJ8100837.1 putative glyoxalase family protein [Lipomyces tetrasporus]